MLITQSPKTSKCHVSTTLLAPLLHPAHLLRQHWDIFVIRSGSDEGASVTQRNTNQKERCADKTD